MLPDTIPEDIIIPTEPLGMKQLAALYHRVPSTLQRAFNDLGIYEAIGQRVGRDFTPEQILIIFALYFPPSKYYISYLWLEKNGYVETLLKKHGLTDFKKDKNKIDAKKSTTKNVKPSPRKKKT